MFLTLVGDFVGEFEGTKPSISCQVFDFMCVNGLWPTNHPSGDPTPSREDIEMTKKVRDAGEQLGIALHDHVIIGKSKHVSFKSLGLL